MMDSVRIWLAAVVAVCVLNSFIRSLIPEGSLRRIAAFTGGVLLLVVLLQPLTKLRIGSLRLDTGAVAAQIGEEQKKLQARSGEELQARIEERTGAYIEDKAEKLGVACTASVTAAPNGEGLPVPWSAELSCGKNAELSTYMEQELGIPGERQVFHGT